MLNNNLKRLLVLLTIACFSNLIFGQELKTKTIEKVLKQAHERFKDSTRGANASYIKELATVDSDIYGIAIVMADGRVFSVGDTKSRVSIQSVSKVFTLAKVIDEKGAQLVQDSIGVDATGEVFNSINAVERMQGKEINPLVNPGAIAATSLIMGEDSAAKWKSIKGNMSAFAGEDLELNMPVYISEANDNLRNQAIAHLLKAYGRMYFDPVQATDVYTKQCALNVNVMNLATMAGTFSNGGVNPVTKKKVVSPTATQHTLAVMSTAGLYDDAGIWLYNTGVPAKSGVGGGLIAVVPGQFGIAVIAPPLDPAGNSVKGQLAIKYIIDELGVNPYLIEPKK